MAEIGYYSLLIALILSAYSGLTSYLVVKGRRAEMIASSENGIKATFFCLAIACFAMVYALITRDFQVEYVAKYTNRGLP
ncbi:MAG: hypothetical protein JSU78_06540 [Deltaproteobacteria bacterium]|nr:MAG: hypothetical protein JSU78_06540 [Deltaproteobacteria bacterium]